ncbi:MAG: cell division protein FtsA [Spirochaetia bacterium]|nr:cell division protein FtsA [Spirochaetia bacterium]MCF7946448.1 cell division protein FtsA [Spirochaetia bacterium]
MDSEKLIVGLDIGSTKICAVAAGFTDYGELEIVHTSELPSEGIRAGVIINIETAMKIIQQVIEYIELDTGKEVSDVVTGISGQHIECTISEGVVGISSKDNEIHSNDIVRSMEVARAIDIPLDKEIIHTLVQDFTIDGRSGIKDPIDMIGHRLETKVMIVTGDVTVSQNLRKCVNRAGYKAKKMVLQQLADSEAVLTHEERDMGTLLIDIGGGMTNMIGFHGGAPVYVGGIGIGGNQVTSDLVYILNKPYDLIEKLKQEYGCCYEDLLDGNESFTIPPVSGWASVRMPRKELCKIIEPRVAEIFSLLKTMLLKNNIMNQFGGGIVLTGGGALMPGTVELASEIFNLPVRLGIPKNILGLEDSFSSPQHAAALGLVLYESKKHVKRSKDIDEEKTQDKKNGFGRKVKDFFNMLF